MGSFSASSTRTGFTAGGGVEGTLWWPNWTWKLEYLYIDLGSVGAPGSFSGLNEITTSASTGASFANTHFKDNLVRVGINYKLTN
jgi:outer membrane immunogenic protein